MCASGAEGGLYHRYAQRYRAIILVVPLLVVLVPLFNDLPKLLRRRTRSCIHRGYAELALLERDVATRHGPLPIERWLQDRDRIGFVRRTLRGRTGDRPGGYNEQ